MLPGVIPADDFFVCFVCLMGILKYMCVFGCAVFYSYRVLIGMCAMQ